MPRLYQQTILGTAANNNTLVVLPTGLGKTAIALLVSIQKLKKNPNQKILMVAPTKPLCEQHVDTFKKHLELDPSQINLFTGNIAPKKREALWKTSTIIISTPQGLENDVINKRVNLKEVSLLIADEAHHATGDYSYVWLAQHYTKTKNNSQILALTASPGADMEKIKEVCQNLFIEKVEVRTSKDDDVKQYIQKVEFDWQKVDFPQEFKEVHTLIKNIVKSKLIEVKTLGYTTQIDLNKGQLLKLQFELQKQISQKEIDFELLKSISLIAQALKAEHALELIETQGITQLYSYLESIDKQALTTKTKATKNLVMDVNFRIAIKKTKELVNQKINHPKVERLKEIIQNEMSNSSDKKMIVFTQFRDSAQMIVEQLTNLKIKSHIFVGQAKKKGLGFSQKQQKQVLDNFRNSQFNILVATSVAEEGLDIPKVDKVIFYEPVPSAVRSIQRRGRTGRLHKGSVSVLFTANTRDEAYKWAAHHKEKRMYKNLDKIKKDFQSFNNQANQKPLSNFIKEDQSLTIVADHREQNNKIVKELINLGVDTKTTQLESADYIVSGNVAVELKKVEDFVNSILDGRLISQVKALKENFPKSLIIIEGQEDIYSIRKINPNAIRGMMAAIVLGFNVPIIHTKDPHDTAQMLKVLAKREQNKDSSSFSMHPQKPKSQQEQLEYVISSFPGIGTTQAKKLLKHFKTIKNITNATIKEIKSIDGIGEKIATRIYETSNHYIGPNTL